MEKLACIPLHGGSDILLDDMHQLRMLVSERHPGAPYVLLGHSMGSFMVRCYITRHGAGLAAAVLSGTSHQPTLLSNSALVLARLIAALRGEDYRSALLHNLAMGALAKTIKPARTRFDWLNTDPAAVDAYIADELCGEVFSVGAYAAMAGLLLGMVDSSAAERIPKELPLLLIAGGEDPVGERGAAVRQAAEMYRQAGLQDVTEKLYPGLRHEILNEPNRREVYQDVLNWLEATLAGQRDAEVELTTETLERQDAEAEVQAEVQERQSDE
jgi:alpha-beta hydrolase superfamily lysophospholipase